MSEVTVKRPAQMFRAVTQSNAKTMSKPSHVFHVNQDIDLFTIAVTNVVYLQRDNPTDTIYLDPAGTVKIQLDGGSATTNRDTKLVSARKIGRNLFIAKVEV